MDNKGVRLHVYMARSGVGSRRACEQLIPEGQVFVNGTRITDMGFKVRPGDKVYYQGRLLKPSKKFVYYALHKPELYLCSNKDDRGRKLAISLVKGDYSGNLFSVGRLDFISSGLILFTNDGNLAQKIAHPSYGIEKEYIVETQKPIKEEDLLRFKDGVRVESIKYQIVSYRLKNPRRVHVVLTEGKKREIRKLFTSCNYKVKRLHRIRIGSIRLGTLPEGAFRPLTQKEVQFLKSLPGRES